MLVEWVGGALASSVTLDGLLVVCFLAWLAITTRQRPHHEGVEKPPHLPPSLLQQCLATVFPFACSASSLTRYQQRQQRQAKQQQQAQPAPPPAAADDPPAPCPLQHIAVIMDGNRRFGRERFADPLKGHWEGGRALSRFTKWSLEQGVGMLTVYAFSTENWRRDPAEVAALMKLFCKYAESMKKEALDLGVQVRVLSTEPDRLPSHVQAAMHDLESSTAACDRLVLNLCVSYGARGEIAQACQAIARQVQAGALAPEAVDEAVVARHLLTQGLPDPDLLIRTSGECRLSNFMLFQLAYAEMVFLDKYWPEVTEEDLDRVLADYVTRERRYGS